ncbi:hypothetical protein [Faecalibacillus faecis]|uniref:hypothetical protein n=1 Tax=Faecalibacillus faecis TaxID=1982628 RepID=UPI0022E20528|nr:hypothetical protein [Faecalibacillus faecis]
MRLSIHKLRILKQELRVYEDMLDERESVIKQYNETLQNMQDELQETIEKLKSIESPQGDGLGGYVQEKNEQFNYLIEKKDKLRKSIAEYVKKNEKNYLQDLEFWNTRIETAEYYLSKMNASDRKFIEDFYYKLSKKECMECYNIYNINSLYRKANMILEKLL